MLNAYVKAQVSSNIFFPNIEYTSLGFVARL